MKKVEQIIKNLKQKAISVPSFVTIEYSDYSLQPLLKLRVDFYDQNQNIIGENKAQQFIRELTKQLKANNITARITDAWDIILVTNRFTVMKNATKEDTKILEQAIQNNKKRKIPINLIVL